MNHQCAVSSWYGLQGAPQKWDIYPKYDKKLPPLFTVPILPCVNGASYGIDTLRASYEWFKADCLISIMDVWVLPPHVTQGLNFAPWFPLDHDPAPDGIVNAIRQAMYPMTQTKWGVEVLAKAGIEAHYIPCSAPVEAFYPGDKGKARKELAMPENVDFLVSMVAANKDPSDRKGFGEALQGFAKFAQSHPNAMLYLHTDWYGPVKIESLCDKLGIKGQVARPSAYAYAMGMYGEDYMRNVYVASDLLLNPAKSEGFCIPFIEAQMTGCPIAASDFSSTRELLFAGWAIPGQLNWSVGADSWRYMVFVDAVVDVLEEAYQVSKNEKQAEALKHDAIRGALPFDNERVARDYWKPALAEIEKLVCGVSKLQLVQF